GAGDRDRARTSLTSRNGGPVRLDPEAHFVVHGSAGLAEPDPRLARRRLELERLAADVVHVDEPALSAVRADRREPIRGAGVGIELAQTLRAIHGREPHGRQHRAVLAVGEGERVPPRLEVVAVLPAPFPAAGGVVVPLLPGAVVDLHEPGVILDG